MGDNQRLEKFFGSKSEEKNPFHKYLREGIYDVSLTIENSKGEKNTCRRKIEVKSKRKVTIPLLAEIKDMPQAAYREDPKLFYLKLTSSTDKKLPLSVKYFLLDSIGSIQKEKEQVIVLGEKEEYLVELSWEQDVYEGELRYEILYGDIPIIKKKIKIIPASLLKKGMKMVDGEIRDREGNSILIQTTKKMIKKRKKPAKFSGEKLLKVAVIDDFFYCGGVMEGDKPYHYFLEKELKRSGKGIRLEILKPSGGKLPVLLSFIADLPQIIPSDTRLFILSYGWGDIASYLAPSEFKKYINAVIDYLISRTEAEIILLTPPPRVMNPLLSRSYAIKIKEIGMEKKIHVVDFYNLFLLYRRGCKSLYQDKNNPDTVCYLYPAETGQILIAETLSKAINSLFY